MPTSLCIRLLGALEVQYGARNLVLPTRKAALVFAYLVLHRRHPQARSRLAGLFWPELSEARARRNLNTEIWRIRRALGEAAGVLMTMPNYVVFDPQIPFSLDIEALDPLPDHAITQQLIDATAAYRGSFLAGYYEDWVISTQERLRGCYLQALSRLVEETRSRGSLAEAADYIRRIIEQEPLREAAHRELIEIHLLQGNRAAAMARYRQCAEILRRELGVAPMAETQALYRDLLNTFPRGLPEVFVGRGAEFARLEAFPETAASLLLVTGESGIGKTALVDNWLASQAGQSLNIKTACQAAGEAAFYRPISDALQAVVAEEGEGFIHALPSPLRSELAQLLPERIPTRTGTGEAQTPTPQQARELLFNAVRRAFSNIGRPLILVLDDLHNARIDTLALLQHLLRRLPPETFRLIGIYQPEVVALSPEHPLQNWLFELPNREEIRLLPLSYGETGELLKDLAGTGTPPHPLSERLFRESEGNPLFIMETIRDLFDRGTLVRDSSGRWALVLDGFSELTAQPLAAGIEAVIRTRLGRLSGEVRSFLALAAVLGPVFEYSLLLEASRQSDERVLDALAIALRGSLLRDLGDGEHFAFSHEKIRAVLYRDIPMIQRAALHERVAAVLEGRDDSSAGVDVEALAHHYMHSERPDAALPHLYQAALKAEKVYAFEAGLHFLDRAVGLGCDFQEAPPGFRYQVQRNRLRYMRFLGRLQQALAFSPEVVRLASALGSTELAEAELYRARLLIACGDWPETATILDAARRHAQEAGEKVIESEVLLLLAVLEYHTQHSHEMNAHLQEALRIAEDAGDSALAFNVTLELAANQGQPALRSAGLERGFKHAKNKGLFLQFTQYATTLVINLIYDGRYGLALAHGAELLDMAEEHGVETLKHSLWRALARCHNEIGSFYEGRDLAYRSLQMCRMTGYRYGEQRALTCLASAEAGLGSFERAVSHFDQAAALSLEIGATNEWFLVNFLAAEAWLRHPDPAVLGQAESLAADCLAVAEKAGYRRARILAHMQLAEALHRRAAHTAALDHSRAAVELLEVHGHAIGREHQVLFTYARALRATGAGSWEAPLAGARSELARKACSLQNRSQRRGYLSNIPLHREIRGFD